MRRMNMHPFPARMAPELAKMKISRLPDGSKILDPMCGSGTTLRHGIDAGHKVFGWDIDPLAVKMSRIWCSRFDTKKLREKALQIKSEVEKRRKRRCRFAKCPETQNFVEYWFARSQREDLNRLSIVIEKLVPKGRTLDFFHIALSRIIVTKFRGASLAWDVSHSRPHKKKVENDFDTILEFFNSVEQLIQIIERDPAKADASVTNKDCRAIKTNEKFDAIITSPPYLNAIDYMRGHKFSLVWMGYTIPELRRVRQKSIGSEKGITELMENPEIQEISRAVCKGKAVSPRIKRFLFRYIDDCDRLLGKLSGHLAETGKLIFVVGNSMQRGTKIYNDKILCLFAKKYGLKLEERKSRRIVNGARYLPISPDNKIGNRMKTEIVLQFSKH